MKIRYRPEIDGLRAIAVMSVVIYHAQINYLGNIIFQGGYLGVDIFFVISGYLITSIIFKEIKITKKFSFIKFYERRIRRIIPALIVVIAASIPFAWIYLLPNDLIEFSWSIISSLIFASNLFFYFNQEYGAIDGLYKPLLHTWSLGVEEQFYILFPFLFYLFFKLSKKNILIALAFFFLISISVSDFGSKNFPIATFYFLHSRIWELLAGSILAYYEYRLGHRSENKNYKIIFPIIGLTLIFLSILFFNNQTRHPSFISLIPIFGTCLIIWFTDKNHFIGKILSSKLFVSIGLISYSIYLWHYPIFAFSRITTFTQGYISKKIFLVLLIFILSIITYILVERPFRNKKNSFKKLFLVIILSFTIIISLSSLFIIKDGFRKLRFENFSFYFDNKSFLSERNKYLRNIDKNFDEENNKKILFIGDSHAEDTFISFNLNKDLFKEYDFSILEFDKKFDNFKTNKNYLKADVIVFSLRFNNQKFSEMKNIVTKIKNKKIIILSKRNEYPYELVYKIKWHKIINHLTLADYFTLKINKGAKQRRISSKDIEMINHEHFKRKLTEKYAQINSKIKLYAKKNNLIFLSQQNFQCNDLEKTCYALTNLGKKIFWDYGHYTLAGAKFFGRKIHKMDWFKID